MKKLIATVFMVVGFTSVSTAALYTNTWNTVEGLSTLWNWGDEANWKVTYGATTPASKIPNADSLTYLSKTANITLQAGDDFHLGETHFLGTVFDRTLTVTIPTDAKLSLDGTGKTSSFGTAVYRATSVNNKTTIDVNGGTLTLGQKQFRFNSNQEATYNNPPLTRFAVRNGGLIAITNGQLRVFGGEANQSTGKGNFTNVIDVLEGGTFKLSQTGWIQFAGLDDVARHKSSPYVSGGYLNIRGGRFDSSECTSDIVLSVQGHTQASYGTYITVSENGEMDFGGKQMSVATYNTNILRVTSGGKITNLGELRMTWGGGTNAYYHNLVDVDGGTADIRKHSLGREMGADCGARSTFRIHGWFGHSHLRIGSIGAYSSWYYDDGSRKTPPWFLDCRLAPHTPRGVRFPMSPMALTAKSYDGSGDSAKIHGINRLSPEGGLQLVHAKQFTLVARNHDSQGDFKYANGYRFIGSDMWTNTVAMIGSPTDQEVKALVGYTWAYVYRATLKDEAQVVDGQALATPRPRAWLQLPKFTAQQLNTNRMERVSVRLSLVAPEGGTLNLDKVVSKMREEGDQAAYADSSVAGYNVRVDLPMDELKVNTTDDRIVMDFVEVDNYPQAYGAVPFVTNALIRAATCEAVRNTRGLTLIVQ